MSTPAFFGPLQGIAAAWAARHGATVHPLEALAQAAGTATGTWVVMPDLSQDGTAHLSAFLQALAHAPDMVRVILLSAAAVYGTPLRQPVMEVDPLLPDTPQGITALVWETVFGSWQRQHPDQGTVIRLGEVAGDGAPPWGFAPCVLNAPAQSPLPVPPLETQACLLGTPAALDCLDALLPPPSGPAPVRPPVLNLSAPPRPLGMVLKDLSRLAGRALHTIVDEKAPLVGVAGIVLDTAAARVHLNLTDQPMPLVIPLGD